MRKSLGKTVLFAALAISALAGCGPGVTHDKVAGETAAWFNNLAEVLEKSETAKAAEPQLKKALGTLRELRDQAEHLEPLPPSEVPAYRAKTLPHMEQAMARYKNAVIDFAKRDPEGIKRLEPLFQELDK